MTNSNLKERILAAMPIETYIGRYVQLRKHGKYLSGLCPFHQEKSPSFTVTPEKGIFHCFGCGKGGNLFTFVMERENVDFNGALDLLCSLTGISRESKVDPATQALYNLNERVKRFFVQQLKENPEGRNYILSRGISESSLEKFDVGFSPSSWDGLLNEFSTERKDLIKLGLVRENKDKIYDFFRNRLMFPILDVGGRTIGFGGRAMPGEDKQAKYINSPDAPIFHKGFVLYGLYHAIQGIRDTTEVLLVEGYLDVIGLSEIGITNVVAPLGTAVTADHIKLAKRYAKKIRVILDGDQAGRNAAIRLGKLCIELGEFDISFHLLPQGMDPFDLSRKFKPFVMEQILSFGLTLDQFVLAEALLPGKISLPTTDEPTAFAKEVHRLYTSSLGMDLSVEEKRRAIQNLEQFLSSAKDAIQKEIYVTQAAKMLSLDLSSLKPEKQRPIVVKSPSKPLNKKAVGKIERGEREIVFELLWNPMLVEEHGQSLAQIAWRDESAELLWRILEGRFSTGDFWKRGDLSVFNLPDDIHAIFHELAVNRGYDKPDFDSSGSEGLIEQYLLARQIELLTEEADNLSKKIRNGADDLVGEQNRVTLELSKLREKQGTMRVGG